MNVKYEFVDFIPRKMEEQKIYISIKYNTINHLCACGCGEEVITPISPTDWTLIYNGKTISIEPSIGNWSYKCKSHYWIKNNKIIWAAQFSKKKINTIRLVDNNLKKEFYNKKNKSIIKKIKTFILRIKKLF
jgi:hypothetical protein